MSIKSRAPDRALILGRGLRTSLQPTAQASSCVVATKTFPFRRWSERPAGEVYDRGRRHHETSAARHTTRNTEENNDERDNKAASLARYSRSGPGRVLSDGWLRGGGCGRNHAECGE